MRKFLPALTAVMLAFTLMATDFDTLKVKADRFFNEGEWASASAMYDLMLDERPADGSLYGRAIVASEMRGDSASVVSLLRKSIDYGVPFDTVFEGVRRESFAIGKAELYERFLLSVKSHHQWLGRTVDNNLMNYYAFRHDGPMMVVYSQEMLKGLPDNVAFMKILASGYLLEGKTDSAIEIYRRIVDLSPGDYESLLYLGNYYSQLFADNRSVEQYRVDARAYLGRAYEIKPTPYVRSLLDKLR